MTKIHLDTDIGGDIDDLCALIMLLKWKDVKITGITTVSDNNGKRAGFTKYALKLANRDDIPVKAGADPSGGYYKIIPGFPKEEDYWPEPISSSTNPIEEALDLLKNNIEQEAVIVGIGPFTNFRLLDEKYPGILKKAQLFLMGGYIYPPREGYTQWGNDMDWNIQIDVNSAKYVLENSNPTLVTMPVTLETYLRRTYLKDLQNSDDLGKLIARQAEVFAKDYDNEGRLGKTCKNLPDDTINFQYDPMACAIALGWNEGVEIKEVPLKFEIKDGFLHEIIDNQGKSTKVVTRVDGDKFSKFWFNLVSKTMLIPG